MLLNKHPGVVRVTSHIQVMYFHILLTELSANHFCLQVLVFVNVRFWQTCRRCRSSSAQRISKLYVSLCAFLHRNPPSTISHVTAVYHPVFLNMYLQSAAEMSKVLSLNALLKGKITAVMMRGERCSTNLESDLLPSFA